MKGWNWIGWTKTIIVFIACIPVFFSNPPVRMVEETQTNLSFIWCVTVGFVLIIANFLLDKFFRKSIIEIPSWNDNPFIFNTLSEYISSLE